MSSGLIALLDDVAAIAKVAASSLDDVAAQAVKAGSKAAGVVIDDAAVTPRYVTGFAAKRELPIVYRIAVGSLRNKLLVLLPAALLLSLFAPWAITPLLMFGGVFLCFEGAEKILEAVLPHSEPADHGATAEHVDPAMLEETRVNGAIKTDFILSAEIMAITLAAVPESSFLMQAAVLGLVGIGITLAVYGAVALIVKADDMGVALVRNSSGSATGRIMGILGRGLVKGMPVLLRVLSVVGTAAMVWVGGGILVHGLEGYGLPMISHGIHAVALKAASALPQIAGIVEWLVGAAGAGLVGLCVGAMTIPLVNLAAKPLWSAMTDRKKSSRAADHVGG